MHEAEHTPKTDGQRAYDDYWARQMVSPEFRAVYDEEAAKKKLWLQLAEARPAQSTSPPP